MKPAAALVILANVLGYLALTRADVSFTLTHPRGGLLTLGISFAIAWVGIQLATRGDLPLDRRFQYGTAAWIWLIVQSFGIGWLYWHAVRN